MTDSKQTMESWALRRVMLLGAVCLAVGMAAGWLIRGWDLTQAEAQASAAANTRITRNTPAAGNDPAQLKAQVEAQAAPLLEQLKAKPDDAALLASIGNLYYDAQQYAIAVDYYGRSLKANPADAAVRTDLGTASWYQSNADAAIAQFNQALTYAPNNPNTLFNLGLVQWQGKGDSAAAVANWQKLLATNPNYEARDKVQHMLTEVQKQAGGPAGAAK
jgi:cytochrome c-type biogenesis protein CcmH/NrfG